MGLREAQGVEGGGLITYPEDPEQAKRDRQ